MSSLVLPLLLAAVGLVLGPLVGLVVDRAVEREAPEAFLRCAVCQTNLGSRSLLPLQAWLRPCSQGHRQWRYMAVDAAIVVLFALAGFRFGASWQLVPYLAFFALLVAMSVIDSETKLLLNILTYPTFFLGLFVVLALSGPNGFETGIIPALLGAGVYGGFLLLTHVIYPDGMGLGDVKLAPSLGLFVGWMTDDVVLAVQLVLVASIIGMLSGGISGILLKRNRKAEVPLGPFIAFGAVVIILTTAPAALSV